MFKYVLFFGFILVLHTSVEGYVELIPAEEKPPEFADQKGCYISKLGFVLEVEVPYSPQDGCSPCVQYVCRADNLTMVFGCSPRAISDNCEIIPGDLELAYPDCCQRVRCIKPDGSVFEN